MDCCSTKTSERSAGERRPRATYGAVVEDRGDPTCLATTADGSFVMSTAGRAANPVDTLLASLCACIGHYARDLLRDRGVAADAFTVTANGTATADGHRLAEIDVRIDVKGATLDGVQRQELLRSAQRCKIYNTLKAGCEIRVALAGP